MIDSIASTALIDKKESIQHRVESIFPTADRIPQSFHLSTPIHQRHYLVDGELRYWEGDVETVISPIHIQTDAGLFPATVGSFERIEIQPNNH